MKTQFIIISLLLLGFTARAQQPYLSREAYRDKVEAYSQILKQQKLKTMARLIWKLRWERSRLMRWLVPQRAVSFL